jgi:beta-mannanase
VRGASWGRAVLAVCSIGAVVGVALIGPAEATTKPPTVARSCAETDAKLVPACGVWWGIWPRAGADGKITNNLPVNLASLEQGVGRQFDIVSRYKGWGQDVYDAWDYGFRDSGHIVLQDLTARNFTTNTYVRWADIASGRYDAYLRRQADRTKAFGARTFFSFNQEPEQALERKTAGTPEEFAAAYRHVRAVFDAAHVTNAVWVWWVMGYSGHNAAYPKLWPGADVVDWIGYDPYDFGPCHGTSPKTPQQTLQNWYRWIDAQPWAAGKPLMLPEYGSNGTDKGAWYAGIPAALKTLPRIKAAVEFNSGGSCVHRISASPDNLAGYRAASQDPYVNPRSTTRPTPADPQSPDTGGTAATCRTAWARLEPACGVLWGVWPRAATTGRLSYRYADNVASLEKALGRRMDVVLRYQGWGQPMFDPADVALRDSGHLVLEDLSVRIFGTKRAVRWADVAAGRHDRELKRQAARTVAFKAPALVSFSQDPRALTGTRGAGSARAYRAAYRHVRAVFDAAGATNAVWVWWVRGEAGHAAQEAALWPGRDVVDWIAYSPVEDSACTGRPERTAAKTFTPWYAWITSRPWAAGKPIALAGYATAGGPTADRGEWYAQVPSALAAMPRVKAAVQFDSRSGGCDFRLAASTGTLSGFRTAGLAASVSTGMATAAPAVR